MNEDERRSHILEVAWKLFTNLGYKATTIETIAKASAMGKGTFYLSFATKEEVLFALVEKAGNSWAASADLILASGERRIPLLIRAYLRDILAFRDQYRLYRNLVFEATTLGTAPVVEAIRRLDRKFEEELSRILAVLTERGLIEACDRDVVSAALLAAYSALIERRDGEGEPFSEERVTSAMEAMLTGGLVREL